MTMAGLLCLLLRHQRLYGRAFWFTSMHAYHVKTRVSALKNRVQIKYFP